jgi:large subunit ribosomal protein L17
MRHGVKRSRFRSGIDANSMLLRKLVSNFVRHGSMVTTQQKFQFMKASVDRLVNHAKRDTESSMNVLTSFFGSREFSENLKKAVSGPFKDRTSGYMTVIKLGRRSSDNAMMVKMSWISPIVFDAKKAVESKIQKSAQPAVAQKSTKAPIAKKKAKQTIKKTK